MRYRFKYASYNLGDRQAGDRVVVTLSGAPANVLLLDHDNFVRYRGGLRFQHLGGLRRRSPIEFEIPHEGHWYVAMDLGGRRGNSRGAIKVLPADSSESNPETPEPLTKSSA